LADGAVAGGSAVVELKAVICTNFLGAESAKYLLATGFCGTKQPANAVEQLADGAVASGRAGCKVERPRKSNVNLLQ
jgi:hypothetical protein